MILTILISSSIFAHKRVEAIALYFAGRAHLARGFFPEGIENLTLALQKNARGIPEMLINAYRWFHLVKEKTQLTFCTKELKHYPTILNIHPELNLLLGLSMYLDDTQITEGKASCKKFMTLPEQRKIALN